MKVPNFKTTGYALLDVGVGRKGLSKYYGNGKNKKIKVLIEGEITEQYGHDDGTSIEFILNVTKLKVKK